MPNNKTADGVAGAIATIDELNNNAHQSDWLTDHDKTIIARNLLSVRATLLKRFYS